MQSRDQIVLVAVLLASVVPISGRTADCVEYGEFIRLIGSIDTNYALGVAVAGPYAYVADGAHGLQVIDVSSPSSPIVVGNTNAIRYGTGVAVADGYAYVADRAYGLRVVDISSPTAPSLLASVDTPGFPSGVAVFGGHAYVADGPSGVHVIDVSEPSLPVLAGTVDTPGEALAVAAAGAYVYVADGSSGFQVLDVSNPTSPAIVAGIDTPSVAALGLTVAGVHAYVADGSSGLQVINVSDPIRPVIVGSVYTPDAAWGTAVTGSYAYVADGYRGLQVVDVSDPALPVIVGRAYTPSHAVAVFVAGTHAYVADKHSGIQIFDVSTPSSPPAVGHVSLDGDPDGIVVRGSHAYVSVFPHGFRVVDFSDPASPEVVGRVAAPAGRRAFGVAVSGSLACVANSPSREDGTGILQVIDISNPDWPAIAGEVETYGYAFGVAAHGDFAYVADYSGIQVVDISDPTTPTLVRWAGTRAKDAVVAGASLYVLGESGFGIWDISSAPSLDYLGGIHTLGSSRGIAVKGNYAYVACFYAGLAIVDVSEPSSPILVGQVVTRDTALDVVVSGTYAYVADGLSGLEVIDVSNPIAPVVIGAWYGLFSVSSVAVAESESGGHVLFGGPGLSILQTQCENVQPVELSTLEATPLAGAILLTWTTSFESDHLGFRVHRAAEFDGEYICLTDLIEPPGPYQFLDTSVAPGITYFYRLEAVDRSGRSEFYGPVNAMAIASAGSQRFMLSQNQPNPFIAKRGATAIGFTLGDQVHAKLRVFDTTGRLVRVLMDEPLDAGPHVVWWDGRSDRGEDTRSGVYYYQLDAGEFSEGRALVRLK